MSLDNTYNAEVAVLSSILNRPDSGWYSHVSRTAGPQGEDLFLDPRNAAIYTAIERIHGKNGIPTPAMVSDILNEDSDLFDKSPSDYVDKVRLHPPIAFLEQMDTTLRDLDDKRMVRRQVRSIQELLTDIDDPEIDVDPTGVASRLTEIVDTTKRRVDTQTFAEIAQEIEDSATPMWTVSTGIPSIDKVLGGRGLESGCFTIAAARAKVGKTIFMNNLVINLLKEGAIPVVLNLETKKVEFVAKIMSRYIAEPQLGWGTIKAYLSKDEETMENISPHHRNLIEDAKQWAAEQNWMAEFDKRITPDDIYAMVAKVKADNPDNARIVLLVDYIQLQVTNSRFEREEITQLSRFYKKLAGELEISVFSLAQLNREAANTKPQVSNLRGSGALEQDADSIILLYNPIPGEDGNDEDTWKYEVMVDASTTRLAAGDDFRLAKDAENQLIMEISDERRAELNAEAAAQEFSDLTEPIL